jgi:cobalamin biosynthesis protein CobW
MERGTLQAPPRARVSVLVVSGFLGSGKTTFVRHLLAEAQREGVRMAVVSNEFGELGIDAALLADRARDYVELEGGCVCCQLSDELLRTLEELRERARPERIVIETSGVALPYDTQLQLWREPVVGWVEDDLAVVVVNAEQLAARRELEGTFEDQVSSADLLLLNQIDRVRAAELPELERQLAELAPDAPILRCTRGAVPAQIFFPAAPRPRRALAPAAAHHHEDFATEQLQVEPGIEPEALKKRIEGLAALRVKGFVQTSAGLRLVQAVGPRVELEPTQSQPPRGALGRLVVIRRV